jgi:hypothetical protein
LDLDAFLEISLQSMKKIADELGLQRKIGPISGDTI